MAVLVKTCCCGCSLRTGVMILGIFGLIVSAYSIYQQSHNIKVYKLLEKNADEFSQNSPSSKKLFLVFITLGYVNLAFKVISLLVNLLLLGSSCSFAFFLLLYGIEWLLSIYFIVVVYSYIKDLGRDPIPPGNIEQAEPPLGMSTAQFPLNVIYPSGTSSTFSSSFDRRQPKSSGWKSTHPGFGGGSADAGGSSGGCGGGGGCD
ncbi:uncharacterized protein LOC113668927 isoform X2 [Pocillopora damicornis]|uniref:uncharacterized protein LOC113668927 isoform X2 n=1 Tax=Pocillopora damicornis TaxID=46731 RepID=UPI000F54CCE6|nr:uncharacterized protein LOC113668927 isoform X2 [Pocillopora damicornis]